MTEVNKPSRWLYLVAVLFLISGWSAAGFSVVRGLTGGLTKGLVQLLVPGEEILELDEAGTYTIFHEYESVYKNQVFSVNNSNISSLELSLRAAATNKDIALRASTSASYSFGSRAARSLYKFDIDSPGSYILSAKYLENDGPKLVLTVSKGFLTKIFAKVFAAIAYVLGGTLLAAGLAIYTFLKRR